MILIFAAFLVGIEAFFTALEVALDAVSRSRMREIEEEQTDTARDAPDEKTRLKATRIAARAAIALRLTESGERLGLSFITVTTLCLWTAAAFVTGYAAAHGWPWWNLAAAFVLMLFVAEVLPLLVAARRAESVLLSLGGVALRAIELLAPLLWLVGALGHGAAKLLGAAPGITTQVTADELRTALAAAEEHGVIESEERAMLEGALSSRDKCVRDVMTARAEIVGVARSASLAEVLEIALREGHSRLPVFGKNGEIAGILANKDLLPHLRDRASEKSLCAGDIMRAPFVLESTQSINRALDALRRQGTLMAVVLENETVVGLVTLEDLLEEIVGEIEDEWDEEPQARIEWNAPAPQESTVEIDRTPESNSERTFAVVCDDEISVREAARVWREAGGGLLRLRESDGHLAESGESLSDFATELFAAAQLEMKANAALRAGDAVLISDDDEEKTDAPPETPPQAQPQPVEIVVREMDEKNVTFALRFRSENRDESEVDA